MIRGAGRQERELEGQAVSPCQRQGALDSEALGSCGREASDTRGMGQLSAHIQGAGRRARELGRPSTGRGHEKAEEMLPP